MTSPPLHNCYYNISTIMLSLQRQFLLKPRASLFVMAVLAQRLPIAFIPEQLLISSMRDNVIHNRCRGEDTRLQALGAEWISPQITITSAAPFAIIAALCGTSAHPVGTVLTVLAAVHTAVAEIGASRIAAGTLGYSWHVPPQMKSSPRSSYTEPPLLFLRARSSAITSATAPSTFSVDFSLSILRLPAGSVRT